MPIPSTTNHVPLTGTRKSKERHCKELKSQVRTLQGKDITRKGHYKEKALQGKDITRRGHYKESALQGKCITRKGHCKERTLQGKDIARKGH